MYQYGIIVECRPLRIDCRGIVEQCFAIDNVIVCLCVQWNGKERTFVTMTKKDSSSSIIIGNKLTPNKEESYIVSTLSTEDDFNARSHLYGATAAYCPRKNFLMSMGWKGLGNFSAASNLFVEVGNGIEKAVVKGLMQNGKLFYNNVYLPDIEPKVAGKIDLIYLDHNNKVALGEVKSCKQLPLEPKPEHLWQTYTYAAISGFDNVYLMYFERNIVDPRMKVAIKVFEIEITQDVLEKVFTNILLSTNAIENKWIPDIPYNFRKSKECLYCQFKGLACYVEEEEAEAVKELKGFKNISEDELNKIKLELKPKVDGLIEGRKGRYVGFLKKIIKAKLNEENNLPILEELKKFEKGS